MYSWFKNTVTIVIAILFLVIFWSSSAMRSGIEMPFEAVLDTTEKDSGDLVLPYPHKDKSNEGDPLYDNNNGGIFLNDPANIKTDVIYNPTTGNYEISQKLGDLNYRPTTYMTLEEYKRYDMEQSMKKYWKSKSDAENFNKTKPLIPKLNVGGEMFDRIFGGNTVDIRPQGSAELIFAVNTARNNNPAIPQKQRKVSTFDFGQKIQLNVIGKIGDKLKLTTSYNTEATFDFENQMKLEYTGYDDEIIQKIEAGNVSLPLNGSLITGSQSLFGIKTALKFGRLTATTVFSQSKGQKKEVTIPPGGGQLNYFTINGDNYEANKHYFLSQYFRDNYDKALAKLPFVNSGVNITRVEVWVTNRTYDINNRNIAGFMDIGELNPFNNGFIYPTAGSTAPDNKSNTLYSKITSSANTDARDFNKITSSSGLGKYASSNFTLGKDFDITVAKKMQPSDFTFNPKLGYISINQPLNNDEVLAVAYQYTLDGNTYQVGEFSTDGVDAPKVLYLKLLKASLTNVKLPTWDLMMKNVYALGAFQIQREDFKLDIVHNDIKKGIDFNYIAEGTGVKATPLVRVLGLDKLNRNSDPQPDGIFDIVEGITINLEKGRIYFPSIEPFGSYLQSKFPANEQDIAKKYIFQALYDSTKFAAQQLPELNRYKIKGSYKSSSGSDISLNALNIPQGSVTVTSGGVLLKENVDYTVDYSLGRVKIINDGILNSGNAIKASYESNSMFSIQQKSLIGTHLDYKVSNDFNIGGTMIHVNERPLTQKVNLGDEPISNTIWGLDFNYRTDAPWLTKAIDFLPLLSTKEKSTINFTGEFAHLIPGHSKAVGKEGQSYIDDFEGSQSTIDIKNQSTWVLASIPRGQPDLFPEASQDSVFSGFNRARFGWYVIDPLFFRDNNLTPEHIKGNNTIQSNNFMREIREQEIFPNRSQQPGQQLTNLPVLDLSFYPKEKGPYNFNTTGIDASGALTNTARSWGGMMRRLETTDFENSNIQYVQFWMMDPFNKDYDSAFHTPLPTRGELYINLGDISEDILPDNRMAFENGLPTTATLTGVDTTSWGLVPTNQVVVNAFDNNPSSRDFQDVGLDGINDVDEANFFRGYLADIQTRYGATSTAYINASLDPSNDDYHFFRGDDYDNAKVDVLNRYKRFNDMQGNSTVASDPYPTQSTTLPNVEDINKDNTLNRNEAYYQYKIKLDPNSMEVGQNYITNKVAGSGTLKNGQTIACDWYQFKVPVRMPDRVVGNIQDFRSMRFIRIFMKGFDQPVVLRMAKLEFLRGEWRVHNNTKFQSGEYLSNDNSNETTFNIGAVNYEENASRKPINYTIPPGIRRQLQANSPTLVQLNEQSLSLSVCGLQDGDERAAFKTTEYDMRLYKKLKMFVHAENKTEAELKTGDLNGYIRLGTDFDQNYYEYEFPLKATKWDATIPEDIWPEENNVEIVFDDLHNAKLARNLRYESAGGDTTNQTPFVTIKVTDKNGTKTTRKITVVGNPNLAAVKVIMLGIRNPKKARVIDEDDGLSKCAEVWVNELRLTDFDDKGGWAALTRVQAKLADFGNVTAAGNISTPGFGTVDQKLNERQKEQVLKYDLAGSFEMNKFLPMKWNIKIPMFVGWSQQFITPRFNPLEPDIEYKKSLSVLDDSTKRKTKERTLDYTQRKSINFTNVKKEKGKNSSKSHLYDVENLAFTYAFTETFHRDYNIEYNTLKTYKAGVNYGFNNTPKNYKPFSKAIKSKSEYFKIVKDFNFTLMPSRIGARADLDRQYTETQNRDNTGEGQIIIPTYNKSFTMMRSYDYAHDLAKAINFTFNASNNSRIDEPEGRYHRLTNRERDTLNATQIYSSDSAYNKYNDSLWRSFKKTLGRTTNYHQTASLNYTLPINKIPIFNWITASAKYTSNYDWNVASLGLDTLGNTIQNSNTKQYNATFNTVTLFNKIPYFKKITSPPKPVPKQAEITKKIASYNDSIKKLDKGILLHEKHIAKLKKKKSNDENVKLTQDSIKKNRKTIKLLNHRIDSLNSELEKNKPNPVVATITKAILSVKNISGSYSENNGTFLPGYLPRTQLMGQSPDWTSPGWDFAFGRQDTNFARKAGEKGWLSKSTALNNAFAMTNSKNLNLRATVEPFKDLKIDLNATKTEAYNKSQFYRWDNSYGDYTSQSPIATGNYSVSIISIKTAFKKDKPSDDVHPYESETFLKFLNSRSDFSKRIGSNNPNAAANDSGFYSGYGATSQDVLIPAFLAAYTGKSPNVASTSAFPAIPLPNWRVTYDGLTKLAAFKKYFKNFSVSHGYRSTYSVGSYTSNLLYSEDGSGNPLAFDNNNNYQSKNIISSISISEQFAPLINADMTWNNSLITKFELKRDRNLNMNFANIQLTEIRGNEVSVGTGYRFKNVTIPLNIGGKKTTLKSDLDIRSDVSVRQSKTIIRKASDQSNQLTAGQNVITIKNSANYVVNERLNIRLFYDRVINKPFVSTSFNTSNTNAGVSVRFTLSN